LRFQPWMKCLQPARRTIIGKVLAGVAFVALGSILVWCVVPSSQRAVPRRSALARMEQNLHRRPVHISEFSLVSETHAWSDCGDARLPEALLTPDPTLHDQNGDLHVRVSFIVGSDGHVHSAFILDSGGPDEDQLILRAVRAWRYRPALCNGVPADSEARVQFALR